MSRSAEKPTAIVIGALHIKDLESKLPKGSFEVYSTKGLRGDEDKLIQELEKFLQGLSIIFKDLFTKSVLTVALH